MANALPARQQGDDYQARCFWMEAVRLFAPHNKVERVGFEVSEHKAFDDVVLWYSSPVADGRGGQITRDYFQIKYHVVNGGALTWESLHTPESFGGKSVSILERLGDAVTKCATDSTQARFTIVTPWAIAADDMLGQFVSNHNGEIRLDKLFDKSTDASKMGRVRKAWRTHLGLSSNDELQAVLAPLRFSTSHGTLDQLRSRLNTEFGAKGFKPLDASALANPYDDLIRKLHGEGRCQFTRDELKAVCEGEGLWVGCQPSVGPGKPIGVRSFIRRAEHLEDVTEELLCLVPHFDYRTLRAGRDWSAGVAADVRAFLSRVTASGGEYLLHLDTHGTIAFFCGACLDTKSGTRVRLVQKRAGGVATWEAGVPNGPLPAFQLKVEEVTGNAGGTAVAVSVSLTHNTRADVAHYVQTRLPFVGRIIHCQQLSGTGQHSVRDGSHAFAIAEEIVRIARGSRTAGASGQAMHLFISAPNGVQFYLGQLSRMLGPITLYEFDPEVGTLGAYQPSLTLPLT